MFTEDVRIKKSAIKHACTGGVQLAVKGEYELNGATYPSGQLVFCGFRGNKVAKDVWGGVYCFDSVGHKAPEESITVERLNGFLAAKAKAKTNRKK